MTPGSGDIEQGSDVASIYMCGALTGESLDRTLNLNSVITRFYIRSNYSKPECLILMLVCRYNCSPCCGVDEF